MISAVDDISAADDDADVDDDNADVVVDDGGRIKRVGIICSVRFNI